MRVALIPLKTVVRDPKANLHRFKVRLEELAGYKPDLVCLPECAFTGYLYTEEDFNRFAEPIPGETTERVKQLILPYGIHICFGMLELSDRGVYNSAVLMDGKGNILHIHRKNNEKPPFQKGREIRSVDTELGCLGIIICGDLFSAQVIAGLDEGLKLLIVLMARAFDGRSPDRERWESEERGAYLEAVKRVGIPTVIVNALEVNEAEPSFGGAMVVSGTGELLAESPHGTDEILVYDFTEAGKYLRVVTEPDRETVHNAFFDRSFKP
jgi:predicted amidohydrolase